MYFKLQDMSFGYALKKTFNFDIADEIAQNVCLKYLTQITNNKIINDPLNWGFIVTKNEVSKIFKLQKQYNEMINKHSQNINTQNQQMESEQKNTLEEFVSEDSLEINKLTTAEAKQFLSKEDFKIFKLILKYGKDNKKNEL